MDPIEQLPAQLGRRNWMILALLLIGSLPFRNPAMSLGVLAGGLIAIGGFLLVATFSDPSPGSTDGRGQGSLPVRLHCPAGCPGTGYRGNGSDR